MQTNEAVVVDANVIKSYYEEDALGVATPLSASPSAFLAECASKKCTFLIDEGGHIQQEWQDPVDIDWYENWFLEFTSYNNVREVICRPQRDLIRKLRTDYGFPQSENVWLIRTAAAGASEHGHCVLATEDMDFYDPTLKGNHHQRTKHLQGARQGAVSRYLEKQASIHVLSVLLCM